MDDFTYPPYSMVQGQTFGREARMRGLSIRETLRDAAARCGRVKLASDLTHWPNFVHGAEEGWFHAYK